MLNRFDLQQFNNAQLFYRDSSIRLVSNPIFFGRDRSALPESLLRPGTTHFALLLLLLLLHTNHLYLLAAASPLWTVLAVTRLEQSSNTSPTGPVNWARFPHHHHPVSELVRIISYLVNCPAKSAPLSPHSILAQYSLWLIRRPRSSAAAAITQANFTRQGNLGNYHQSTRLARLRLVRASTPRK